MKPASCKAKGRALQNWLCDQICELFSLTDADVKPAIMGESGMDIKLSAEVRTRFGYAAECKNTEKLNLWEAWEQALANAEKERLTPILFVKRNRTTPLVVMDARQGLTLIRELYEKDQLVKKHDGTQRKNLLSNHRCRKRVRIYKRNAGELHIRRHR